MKERVARVSASGPWCAGPGARAIFPVALLNPKTSQPGSQERDDEVAHDIHGRLCLCVGQAFAADSPAKVSSLSPARLQAATELLQVLIAQKVALALADALVNAMIQSNPMMGPYRAVMMQWTEKTLSWRQVGPKFARLYAVAFTRSVLEDLIRFYQTPTGQKAIRELPMLATQGALLGEQIARAHIAELRQMIKARAAQLQKVSP
ncbi:MAG: DUF2059 domain-containing protein [Steroidobacteraceae bacterium]